MNACWRERNDGITVAVRVTPRAARDRLGGVWRDGDGHGWLIATVTAPPDDGRANAAVIGLLAHILKVPRTSISLEAGGASRLKRLHIRQDTAGCRADIARRIGELI